VACFISAILFKLTLEHSSSEVEERIHHLGCELTEERNRVNTTRVNYQVVTYSYLPLPVLPLPCLVIYLLANKFFQAYNLANCEGCVAGGIPL
jgi:hypothetical protein